MAKKKTLESIKKCPVDFLYLWATDDFISQLGNKASIIRSKKYNQYQTLWKTMVENVKADSQAEYQTIYNQWVKEIGNEIENTYGMTPATILQQLALGKDVLGKNWSKGVYGVSGSVSTTFVQNNNVTVDPATGKILVGGKEVDGQTPIYGEGDGENAVVTGYSYYDMTAGEQFQSGITPDGQYGSVCYSDGGGVQKASGGNFDPTYGSFWQNASNYMPLVEEVVRWLMSLADSAFAGQQRQPLTTKNTVPTQNEWVETTSSSKGLWIAGGVAAVGLALFATGGKKRKKD